MASAARLERVPNPDLMKMSRRKSDQVDNAPGLTCKDKAILVVIVVSIIVALALILVASLVSGLSSNVQIALWVFGGGLGGSALVSLVSLIFRKCYQIANMKKASLEEVKNIQNAPLLSEKGKKILQELRDVVLRKEVVSFLYKMQQQIDESVEKDSVTEIMKGLIFKLEIALEKTEVEDVLGRASINGVLFIIKEHLNNSSGNIFGTDTPSYIPIH